MLLSVFRDSGKCILGPLTDEFDLDLSTYLFALAFADDVSDARYGLLKTFTGSQYPPVGIATKLNGSHKYWMCCVGSDRALQYDAFNQLCQRLGCHAGLEDLFTPYCIRRGVANAVDGNF